MRGPLLLGTTVLLGAWATPGLAQPFAPITSGDYRLDLYQGAVLGSTRITGLGGAYAAIAEGTEGIAINPASAVNRPYHSNAKHDWTWHLDVLFSSSFGVLELDFDNNGRRSPTGSTLLTAGFGGYAGDLGIGATLTAQQTSLGEARGQPVDVLFLDGRLVAGWAFLRHQLLVAGGVRAGGLFLERSGAEAREALADIPVFGVEAGALWRPRDLPLRVGATFSLPLFSTTFRPCDERCPSDLILPDQVSLPWEARLGAAYAFGERPFNPTPDFLVETSSRAVAADVDLDRDYRGGRYVLFSAEVVVVGPASEGSIGPDGFLAQELEPVGESVVVSARFGVESEVLRRRLRARLGTYWEPSRYRDRAGRQHATGSLLVRLFDLHWLGHHSIAWAPGFDVAQGYYNVSFLLSLWH